MRNKKLPDEPAAKKLPDELLARRAAGISFADIRTVRRVLRGESVRGVVADRIRAALAVCGKCVAPGAEVDR